MMLAFHIPCHLKGNSKTLFLLKLFQVKHNYIYFSFQSFPMYAKLDLIAAHMLFIELRNSLSYKLSNYVESTTVTPDAIRKAGIDAGKTVAIAPTAKPIAR